MNFKPFLCLNFGAIFSTNSNFQYRREKSYILNSFINFKHLQFEFWRENRGLPKDWVFTGRFVKAEALELERRPPDPPLLDFKLFRSEVVGNFEAQAPCLSKP